MPKNCHDPFHGRYLEASLIGVVLAFFIPQEVDYIALPQAYYSPEAEIEILLCMAWFLKERCILHGTCVENAFFEAAPGAESGISHTAHIHYYPYKFLTIKSLPLLKTDHCFVFGDFRGLISNWVKIFRLSASAIQCSLGLMRSVMGWSFCTYSRPYRRLRRHILILNPTALFCKPTNTPT
ncbi:hypothetical protein Nepgr_007398 [Nepenthes gracilis]|uniref:Uncharacterized protein n=1 Tax=Nepenthes gracilis TaxID=150966 RepID=A0AAD3S6X6_NEPGR|nr:hypothetical protein Nepgr_007398 [Nepenthes gracilis]